MIENIIDKFVDYIISDSNIYFSFDDSNNEVSIKKIPTDMQGGYLKIYPYLKENPNYIKAFKEFLIKRIELYNSNHKIEIKKMLLYISNIVLYIDNRKKVDFDDITYEYEDFYFILSLFNKAFENNSNISSLLLDLNNKFAENEFIEFREVIDKQEKTYKEEIKSSGTFKFRVYIDNLISPINLLNFLINSYFPFTEEQKEYVDLTYMIAILNKQQKYSLLKYFLNKDKSYGKFNLTEKANEYLINNYFKNEFLKLTLK